MKKNAKKKKHRRSHRIQLGSDDPSDGESLDSEEESEDDDNESDSSFVISDDEPIEESSWTQEELSEDVQKE